MVLWNNNTIKPKENNILVIIKKYFFCKRFYVGLYDKEDDIVICGEGESKVKHIGLKKIEAWAYWDSINKLVQEAHEQAKAL